ncbi:NAD(P)-dependent oxidoreductase [[Clostridium] colinum]|uniref:NAD(P)-dependent oxidoreductase n=1 Tax=[Clostridium] colinum TaxID=36835 RepID=UPI0020246FE2|nr:NAD(P)-dependent oxidoreductase [[Clostridium] colinum]
MLNKLNTLDVLDLTKDEALEEAKRCLNCKKPLCVTGCPIQNNIPQFIKAVVDDDLKLAYKILSEKTNLPAICGKICAHEKQCEGSCILGRKKTPVKIGRIENFIANYAYENNFIDNQKFNNNLSKVAIVGSGPSGLSCAYILAKDGFNVDIYEMEEKPGGILSYGIPTFRLPTYSVDREIEKLKNLGVNFILNSKFGKDFSIETLKNKGYNAIFLSTGANMPKSINIKGENLNGVIHANQFLTDFAKDKNNPIIKSSDIVLVIGGGNVAMDASRTAKILTDKTTVVYRRTREEMPASLEEYEEAVKDNVNFMWRCNPLEFIGEDNKVTGLKVKNLDTEEEFIIPCTIVLTAIGSKPIVEDNSIKLDDWGCIKISDSPFGMTNIDGVFAGGDVVNGPDTVVVAMREGRKTAHSIKEYISSKFYE